MNSRKTTAINALCAISLACLASGALAQEQQIPPGRSARPSVQSGALALRITLKANDLKWIPWNDSSLPLQYLPNTNDPPGVIYLPILQNAAPAVPDVRVELNFNNLPVQDALNRLFRQVSKDNPPKFQVDDSVPRKTRVSLRLKNVKFLTALNAITEQADVEWNQQIEPCKEGSAVVIVYHIGKGLVQSQLTPLDMGSPNYNNLYRWNLIQPQAPSQLRNYMYYLNILGMDAASPKTGSGPGLENFWFENTNVFYNDLSLTTAASHANLSVAPQILSNTYAVQKDVKSPGNNDGLTLQPGVTSPANGGIPTLKDLPVVGRLFTTEVREQRSVFTCPHCHREATLVTKAAGAGTTAGVKPDKTAVSTPGWRFCPYCGTKLPGK